MPEEAEKENEKDDEGVIDAEVLEIALTPNGRFADGGRAGEGRQRLEKLAPRP